MMGGEEVNHPATEEIMLRNVLGDAARRGDWETVELAARSVRYWAMRLRLGDPGRVEQDLSLVTGPDSSVLAQVIRQGRHLLRSPDAPWQSAAAGLLLRLEEVPSLASIVEETEAILDRPWLRAIRALPRTTEAVPVQTLSIAGPLRSMVVAEDGNLIVSGHEDGSISVWGVPQGDLRAVSPGHASFVGQVAVSPDAARVVSTDFEELQIWDPATGSRMKIPLTGGPLVALGAHPDGSRFAVADGPSVRFFDYEGQLVPLRQPFVSTLLDRLLGSMARFKDGRTTPALPPLALGLVLLWTLLAIGLAGIPGDTAVFTAAGLFSLLHFALFGRLRLNLRWPRNLAHVLLSSFHSLCFAPEGHVLATAEHGGRVRLWCTTSGRLLKTFREKIHGTWSTLAFNPAGIHLAVVDGDSNLTIWDTRSGTVLLNERNDVAAAGTSISWSPDGTWLAYGADHSVRVRQLAVVDGTLTATRSSAIRLPSGTTTIALVQSGQLLLTAGDTGASIRLWDYQNLREQTGEGRDDRWVRAVAYHPEGDWLALASEADRTLLLSPKGIEIARLPQDSAVVHGIATAPDGSWAATGDWDGMIRLWSPEGQLISEFGDHSQGPHRIYALTVSATGQLAAACSDGKVRVWNTNGRLESCFEANIKNDDREIDFSRPPTVSTLLAFGDGLLATTGGDETIEIHRLDSSEPPKTLHSLRADGTALVPADGSFTCLAHSPHGRSLAAGHWNGEVSLWELDSGALAPRLVTGMESVQGLAYSPCGSLLLTIGGNNQLKIWDLTSRMCLLAVRLEGSLLSCAWSPAGDQIACGGSSGVFHFRLRFPPDQDKGLP
ncbi:hypothetical protein DMH26_18490 [Streptomyces sp. WAC 05379]|nr:hypothetical protein DMH26_18490 [Streptomyces sp. WAC 05379]